MAAGLVLVTDVTGIHIEFPVSETQAMKQLGNSVAVPAIQATANEIIKRLK